MNIKLAPIEDIWQMRQRVMYPDSSIEKVQLPDDASGVHLGLYEGDKIISIVSLFVQNRSLQFRKFATLPFYQNKGYGTYLLNYVFDYARKQQVKLVWCNARISAIGLYKKMGMEATGTTWESNGYTYIKMQKELAYGNHSGD